MAREFYLENVTTTLTLMFLSSASGFGGTDGNGVGRFTLQCDPSASFPLRVKFDMHSVGVVLGIGQSRDFEAVVEGGRLHRFYAQGVGGTSILNGGPTRE